MTRGHLLSGALVAVCIAACTDSRAKPDADWVPPQPGSITFEAATGEVKVAVEIADTPAARTRGLMYRDSLDANAGMVFVFPEEADHSFWMKNTHIPLDMIFVSSAMAVVGIVQNAEPLTETSRAVGTPSQYVVETNGGFAASHGIVSGTRVAFFSVPRRVTR